MMFFDCMGSCAGCSCRGCNLRKIEAKPLSQRGAAEEGLSEDQLALFDLVQRADLTKVDRERTKLVSKELLAGVLKLIAKLDHWTEKEQTQAEVETYILNHVYQELPEPLYTPEDKAQVAQLVYRHIWQQSLRYSMTRGAM